MIENPILLIYLWGIYEQVGNLIIVIMALVAIYILVILITLLPENDLDRLKNIKLPAIIFLTLLVLQALTPTRNIAVMMVSAPTILEVAQNIKDSNRTAKLTTILDNSLNFLEKKSKELK